MEKVFLIWMIALTILYGVLSAFQVDVQNQINDLEKRKQERFDFITKEADDKANSPTDGTEYKIIP